MSTFFDYPLLRAVRKMVLAVVATLCCFQNTTLGDDVTYGTKNDKPLKGFLATPEATGKRPAIILIHEWWGLNDDIRAKAEAFAKQGYVALAVDLYGGKSTTTSAEARKLASAVRGDMDGAFANLKTAVAYLKQQTNVDGTRIASIGWCFGGGWSYQMARNNLGVKASVIYYGSFSPEDDLSKMRTEILGHFAENDRSIRVDQVNAFGAKLKTLEGHHEIYIYPNTSHGFASRPDSNRNYAKDAAETAWKRTMAFLKKYL